MKLKNSTAIIYLSVFLALFLTVVSFSGAFISLTYRRETISLAVQGMGQDIFDLFIVVPVLLISLFFSTRGSRKAIFIFGGTVLYIVYSFFIYSFGVHFNNLFLLYCFTLGSSFYLFILIIVELVDADVENWFDDVVPVGSTAAFLIVIAIMFYYLWFSDIIPAILSNTIPKSVSDYNLLINPVHVMDLSFVLPGLILTAVMLIKKHRTGLVLAPLFLVFIILLSLALITMAVMLNIRNISEDFSLVLIFGVLAVISTIYIYVLLRRMKSTSA
jgi:hypothetical protein